MNLRKERSPARLYLAALVIPALVTVLMQVTWPFFESAPFALFLLAVTLCAWYGGFGPGLASILASLLLADYFFLRPFVSLRLATYDEGVRLLIFSGLGLFISVLSGLRHKGKQSAHFDTKRTRKHSQIMNVSLMVSPVNNTDDVLRGSSIIARDLTSSKQAEDKLRASEERYRSLFEDARDALYVHDLNGVYLSVNRAAEKLCGYPREEIIGKNFTDFIAPENVEEVRKNLFRKLVIQRGTSYEVEIVARDGRRVPVEVTSNLIYQDGIPVGVQGAARDISGRRRAEDAVREAERKYREIFENAEEGIFQSTFDGILITANPAMARMFGYASAEELLNASRQIVEKHYVQPERRVEFLRELRQKGAVRDFEYQAFRKDGSKVWISENVRAVFGADGKIAYCEGTATDITTRKQYQRALLDSEERFRATFEQSAVSTAMIDANGKFLQVNAALCDYLGYSENELLGLSILDVTHPKNRAAAAQRMNRLKTDLRSTIDREYRYVHKDGKVLWGDTKIVALLGTDSLPNYSIAVIQDVTERRLAHQALQNFSRRLIEAQETERQAIARELHDEIGQVLTAVRISLDSMRRNTGDLTVSRRVEDNLAVIDEALAKVRDLSLNLHPALLDDLGLQSALRWYSKRYSKQTGIKTELTIDGLDDDERLPSTLEIVSYRVMQEALTNVARHAKATRAAVALWRTEGCLVLSVKDNGVGFEVPPRQFRNATLGVRGMQERAEGAGGILELKSDRESGTEVLLILPLIDAGSNGHEEA